MGEWLIQQEKLAIKYDAWQEDYSENPLLSLLATLNEQLKLFEKGIKKEIVKNIKKYSFGLIKALIPAIIRFIMNMGVEYLGAEEPFKKLLDDLNNIGIHPNNDTRKEIQKN